MKLSILRAAAVCLFFFCFFFGKAGKESVAVVHPAGNEKMSRLKLCNVDTAAALINQMSALLL